MAARTVLLAVLLGALVGWLPSWAGQIAVPVALAWYLVDSLPQIVRGVRSGEADLGLPRIDPDYSRRR